MPSKAFSTINLDSANLSFSRVMANGMKYRVPPFQRNYSWEEAHWDELWSDMEEMRESRTQHFMGYLVFQSKDNKSYEVIDGQQRLTTLTLMVLAAISRLEKLHDEGIEVEDNKKRMDSYQAQYIGVFDPIGMQTTPKLTLSRHNEQHFRNLIQDREVSPQRNITPTNRYLNQAFQFFSKKFQGMDSGAEIAEHIEDITEGLLFTAVTVQDTMDAYTVFETLNARGVQLAIPDLLKNYLLSTLAKAKPRPPDSTLNQCENRWVEILEQLGETSFTKFLRTHRSLRHDLVHEKALFRKLREDVTSAKQVTSYLRNLRKHAPVYAALQNPHDSFWANTGAGGEYADVSEHLQVLDLFSIKTPLSLLMAGFDQLNSRDFISLAQYIVNVSIRYNVICRRPPNAQERIYSQMAKSLMEGKKSNLQDVVMGLKPLYPSDEDFQKDFALKTMPSSRSNKRIVFLLKCIEKQLNSKAPDDLTLEHVLPANPDDDWQQDFGRTTYNDAIDRLGNMALLSGKANLAQEPFDEKREILQKSGLRINQNIAKYDQWNIDNLGQHQNWLANQAKTVWKISQLS